MNETEIKQMLGIEEHKSIYDMTKEEQLKFTVACDFERFYERNKKLIDALGD